MYNFFVFYKYTKKFVYLFLSFYKYSKLLNLFFIFINRQLFCIFVILGDKCTKKCSTNFVHILCPIELVLFSNS